MPIVNYVREHTRFIEYASDEHLTAGERLLWYALMHVMNQRAQGNVWPEEFIRISNDRLLTLTPMRYDTLSAARNGLKQRGLIEYVKGEKNKVSPAYRMKYFYPQYADPDTEKDGFYPEKSDNIRGNIGGNIGGNTGGNIGDYNINNKQERQINGVSEDDEEAVRARAREEARESWQRHFGKALPPAAAESLAWRTEMSGFEPGVLEEAVRIAASKCAESPIDYVICIIADWKDHNIRTKADAEKYAPLFDAAKGRSLFISADEAREEMRAMAKGGDV